MASSRTYSALGAGWQTWIDLDGSGKAGIVLTGSGPHAYVEDADEAKEVFNVVRGPAIDNIPGPGGENTRAFTQEFPQAELARLKIVSEQHYAPHFEAARKRAEAEDETKPIEVAPVATAKKASKKKATASG